jgi:UDP-glucuronate 4-epimerase
MKGIGMCYLVTGGAGFIGSHVAQQLLARGERVVIIDNFNDYYDPAVKHANIARLEDHPNLTVIEGDVRDAALIDDLFAKHGITHVAHMAAMAGVRSSVEQVRLYMEVNVTGSMNLLEAARKNAVKLFVFASTSSVYGATEVLPFIETDTADRPLASYPASKRSAELLAHTYHHLFGMNITILRFFNVYGPAGRPDMMPLRLMNAAFDGAEIPLFNNGDISRDWTYIDDTVKGVVAALDRPLGYEVINLGCGNPISMRTFVDIIEEYTGRQINTRAVPTPPSDPPITFCNSEKARRLLDFAPEVDIKDGLRYTWEWFHKYNNL